jgi:pyruvate kinase
MNVARLNFSHGTPDEHRTTLEMIRALSVEMGVPVAVLQDLQGPKIRTGPVQNPPIHLAVGAPFTITTLPYPGTSRMVSTTYPALPSDVHPGDRILLSDGAVELIVVETTPTEVRCRVVRGGAIGSHTGINLPGVTVSAPALTEKDERDLRFGLAMGVDFVALSFVRTAEDVEKAKKIIAAEGHTTPLIAKLEKPQAIERLEEILAVSDGVMVARGDLGVEMPAQDVPLLQKRIIAAANRHALPVITATQMLESMVQSPRATRAEASDVANAIFDGTDATMLSAETAIGKYPIEAVLTMAQIAVAADTCYEEFGTFTPPSPEPLFSSKVIAEATNTAARRLDATAIAARTSSGFTARLVSKYRPPMPVLALTSDPMIARRTLLLWGITPIVVPNMGNLEDLVARIDAGEIAPDLLLPGKTIVLTASSAIPAPGGVGTTNILQIHQISPR